MSATTSSLREELGKLEGILGQNPETGELGKSTYIGDYTNRVFGAPYQLLDSVDKRFNDVNSYLGSEYLRNFIINSPILHIRPGMPKYTGEYDRSRGIVNAIRNLYMDVSSGNMSFTDDLLLQLAERTIFNAGSKLQRRMFGFRETYYDYMSHVNYMCRSEAIFLNLTDSDEYPHGTFVNDGSGNLIWEDFSTIKWENYRLLKSTRIKKPSELLASYGYGAVIAPIQNAAESLRSGISNIATWLTRGLTGDVSTDISSALSSPYDSISQSLSESQSIGQRVANKTTSVDFMVEPLMFEESITNNTKNSFVKDKMDSISDDIGSEIGFITNSGATFGMLDGVMNFLGNTTEAATMALSGITQNLTGGFMSNLFSGAVQSIKGQKMIYPKIYQSTEPAFNYSFSLTLTTPYGDPYNYFMNIIVPLMHLIALAAPRMVSSNSTTSPYLVQAYIPGQCTCHLGIIQNITLQKNPDANHVSVHGFPLTVKVTFVIEELYNAMAISPANDPSSFLFNETLNDYMANLAGLIPSVDTYTKQRHSMLLQLGDYISHGEFVEDFISNFVEDVEDLVNPFVGR